MKPEKQRIAIAEACGWTGIEDRSATIMMAPGTVIVGYRPHAPIVGKKENIPEYLNDLNAIVPVVREWLKTATLYEVNVFRDYLFQSVGINPYYYQGSHLPSVELCRIATATAQQWCQAWLKTLRKWEEE